MKMTIVGAGSWGLALAKVLANNGHEVLVYDVNKKVIEKINTLHICYQLNEEIPKSIHATSDINEAMLFSNIIQLSVPTKVLRIVLKDINNHITKPKLFINTSKGIEPDTFMRVSDIVTELIDEKYLEGYVNLSGPSHAEEVIKCMPTTIVAASNNDVHSKEVQYIYQNNQYLRVYTSNDLIGAELGGALKNVYAVASGMLVGCGIGDNGRAALITRGLVEMRKLYQVFGAKEETLYGLTGIGDLVVTCTSEHSRNYQAGYKIGHGKDLEETLNSMTMVVEGIRTCEAAYNFANNKGIDTPIINAIYDVVYNKVKPSEVLSRLLSRELKPE